MSLQNLYLSWGGILSPNWKASWSFYTHGRHTQGQCLGMYGDQAASFSWGGKQGFKVQPRHGRKVDPWCQPVLPSSSQTSIFLPLQSSRVPSWICWGPFGPLSSPAFPPWHGIVLQPSHVPQEGAHLKLLFLVLLLLASLSPVSSLSRGLKQQSHSANTPAA